MGGYPTAAQLAEAVEQFLRDEVMPAVDGRLAFQARVAANVMAILQRELTDGAVADAAHSEALAVLGFADDASLVQAIRSGQVGEPISDLLTALRPAVEANLRIANPKYIDPGRG